METAVWAWPARAFEPVLTVAYRNPDIFLMAGLAYQRLGRRAEARAALERAAALGDTYTDVHVALGVLEYSEGRVTAARARFDRALALDPGRQAELQVWLDRTAEAGQ
jgi:tetratricopeptide (TPR) repeat protein